MKLKAGIDIVALILSFEFNPVLQLNSQSLTESAGIVSCCTSGSNSRLVICTYADNINIVW